MQPDEPLRQQRAQAQHAKLISRGICVNSICSHQRRESRVESRESGTRKSWSERALPPSPPPPLTFLKCEAFREFLGSQKHTLSCHVHPSENNHEEALIVWTMFAKVSKASRECGWTKVSEAAADETFLQKSAKPRLLQEIASQGNPESVSSCR